MKPRNHLRRAARASALSIACATLPLLAAPAAIAATSFGDSGPGKLTDPTGIAVGNGGAVYVVDRLADRVVEFSSSGAFIRAWGGFGTKEGAIPAPDGKFFRPDDVATNASGDVYVTDRGNNRVQRFDENGTFLGKWGANGGNGDESFEPGGFRGPSGLGIDPAGNVAVADTANSRVQRFTGTGVFLGQLGSKGAGNDRFYGPLDVAVDAGGNHYVAANGWIHKLSTAGAFLAQWYDPGGPARVVIDSDGGGGILVVDEGSDLIWKHTPNGALVGPPLNNADYGIDCPRAIALDRPYLYVAESRRNVNFCDPEIGRVVKVDLEQPFAELVAPSSPVLTGQRIHFDASGSRVPFAKIERYEWDLDGNGTFETDTGSSPKASRVYREPRTLTVRVRVTSAGGKSDQASRGLEVRRSSRPGPVGVSIENGARFTNDRHVRLSLRWPPYTRNVTMSNDGGFVAAKTVPVRDSVAWTLDPRGPDRLPRTVYVRFDGSTQTFQDDIFLDRRDPVVRSASLTPAGETTAAAGQKRAYRLHVRATDNLSGVNRMQVTADRARPGKLRRFRSESTVMLRRPHAYVRVRDAAGNFSRWREATAD